MFFMDKEAGNGPRTRVEILVGTPGNHIHSPVMEVKLNVTSCMGQVKTNIPTLRERRVGGWRGNGDFNRFPTDNPSTLFDDEILYRVPRKLADKMSFDCSLRPLVHLSLYQQDIRGRRREYNNNIIIHMYMYMYKCNC